MALTNAEKQARYRRRQAVREKSNAYTVTVFRRECERTGQTDLYGVALECALGAADAGGNGALLLERLAFLLYGAATAAAMVGDPPINQNHSTGGTR